MSIQENNAKRFALYQAGRCVVQTLLWHHPEISVLKMTEFRDIQPSSTPNLFSTRTAPPVGDTVDLESLLLGCLAGKAGELFHCHPIQERGGKRLSLFPANTSKASTRQRKALLRVFQSCEYKQLPGGASSLATQQLSLQRGSVESRGRGGTLFAQDTQPSKATLIASSLSQSDMGLLERTRATLLVRFLCINQSIYFPNLINLQKSSKVGNLNRAEISNTRALDLFYHLQKQLENIFSRGYTQGTLLGNQTIDSTPLYHEKEFVTKKIGYLSQKKEISVWCEERVCTALMCSNRVYGQWFRMYLPQIETHQRQPVSRDQFSTTRRELEPSRFVQSRRERTRVSLLQIRALPSSISLNTRDLSAQGGVFAEIEGVENGIKGSPPSQGLAKACSTMHLLPQELGYGVCHTLTLQSFSQAINLIGQNRELFDILADHLIRFGKIRLPDILRISPLYVDMTNP